MEHTRVHAVIEHVDKLGNAVDTANSGVNVVAKGIAASHAFRKYDWLHKVPKTNAAGNSRGMVVNANARVVYDFTVKYGAWMERLNTFVTVGVALADSAEQIYAITQSNDEWPLKGARLGAQATAVAMNALTGIVTTPVHYALFSVQGYCDIADLALGKQIGTSGKTLKAIDSIIESSAKQVSDGNNIYTFVNTTINSRLSKAMGL